ncbi:Unknown protein sequence [Pseudomonas syringae pv. syringae]|nr:Unknown protein sequence [Pseudomonas syringae pv. syringae]
MIALKSLWIPNIDQHGALLAQSLRLFRWDTFEFSHCLGS